MTPDKIIQTRRRSDFYYYARDKLESLVDMGTLDDMSEDERNRRFKPIVENFRNWMDSYSVGKCVMLENDENVILIRLYNRFMRKYRSRLYRRFKKLEDYPFKYMFTLTLDPKPFWFLGDMYKLINVRFNKLRSWMYKKYGRFEYMRILEVMKKGRPHLHVLVDIDYMNFGDVFRAWERICGGVNWVKVVKVWDRFNAVKYLLKYVKKSFNPVKGGSILFGALLFASNRRLWSISRKLQDIVRRKKVEKQGYVFMGVVRVEYVAVVLEVSNNEVPDKVFIDKGSTKVLNRLFDVIGIG